MIYLIKILCDEEKKVIFSGILDVCKEKKRVMSIQNSILDKKNLLVQSGYEHGDLSTDNVFTNLQFSKNGTAFKHNDLGIVVLTRPKRIYGEDGLRFSFELTTSKTSSFAVSPYILKEYKSEPPEYRCIKNRCRIVGTCPQCRARARALI